MILYFEAEDAFNFIDDFIDKYGLINITRFMDISKTANRLRFSMKNENSEEKNTDKNVSHPEHYQSEQGLEVIDVIEAFTADLSGIEATDTGNIIKYACRWSKKNGIQDLKKLVWYAQHLISYLENKEEEGNV